MIWLLYALLAFAVLSGRWFDAGLVIVILLLLWFVAACVKHVDSTKQR